MQLPFEQCPLGFGQDEFDHIRTQVLTELQYLGLVREYQNNVVGLLQSEQANVSLLLQQASAEVLGNISYQLSTTSSGNWRSTLQESFEIAGPLISAFGGFFPGCSIVAGGINEGFTLTDFFMNGSSKRTYDINGRSLQEQVHDQIAVSALARKQADQYAATLTSVGVDFRRIVSDWGRLQTAAISIQTGQFSWGPQTTAALLATYNTSICRSFYSQLLPVSYRVVHYRYALPGTPGVFLDTNFRSGSSECAYYLWMGGPASYSPNLLDSDAYAFIPARSSTAREPPSPPPSALAIYPTDVWRDLWVLPDSNGPNQCAVEKFNPNPIPFRRPASTTPPVLSGRWTPRTPARSASTGHPQRLQH